MAIRTLESIFDVGSMMRNRMFARQSAAREKSEHETKMRGRNFEMASKYVSELREWIEGERGRILRSARAEDLVELKAYQRVIDKLDADRRESEKVMNG